MAIIINDPYARGGGAEAGKQFGDLLSTGLKQLATTKMQNMQKRQEIAQLAPLVGNNSQLASLLAGNPKLQEAYFKQQWAQPGQESFAQALGSLLGGGEQTQQSIAEGQPQAQMMQGQQTQQPSAISTQKIPSGLNAQQAMQLAQLGLQKQALSKKEVAEQRKQEIVQNKEMRKEQIIEQHLADKETKPYYDEVHKEAKAAKNNDKRLEKMEALIKTGKLANPIFASLIKTIGKGIFGFGIDLSSLQNPESQQFEKLSNDFIREAKSIFGNRLTDTDLNYFLKTIPTLSLSNDGKMKVIQNMREFNEATKIKERAMNDIIKANDGRRPRNLLELVDEQTAPEIDALAERFKKSIVTEAPETESFVGSLVKAIPRTIFG